jgi:catechol 2,3-dioxygenase-like lactoylglutathione lyase family enzyme
MQGEEAAEGWAALVPELLVTDLDRALAFYRDACGFRLRFARPEDGFAYLALGAAQIMLEEIAEGAWVTGPLDPPLGRGVNLQIEVPDVAALAARLSAAGVTPFRPTETAWYREGDTLHGQAELMVQDPDGYLLRFVQVLGERPA